MFAAYYNTTNVPKLLLRIAKVLVYFVTVLLFLIGTITKVEAQELSLLFSKKINNIQLIALDDIGNTYVVYNKNQILQLNEKGDSINYNSFLKYGKITNLDVSNPLEILVGFNRQNSFMVLDRMLTPKMSLNLNEIGLSNVKSAAYSSDGKYWLYNPLTFQIIKINHQLQRQLESNNLNAAYQIQPNNPRILERNNMLLLSDPQKGWYLFDRYANYLEAVQLDSVTMVDIVNALVVYLRQGKLYYYDSVSKQHTHWNIDTIDEIRFFAVSNDRLIVSNGDKILVYAMK